MDGRCKTAFQNYGKESTVNYINHFYWDHDSSTPHTFVVGNTIIWVNVSNYTQRVYEIGYMKLHEPGSFSIEEVTTLLHDNGPEVTWKLAFRQDNNDGGMDWTGEKDGKPVLEAGYYVYQDRHGPRPPCLKIEPASGEYPPTGALKEPAVREEHQDSSVPRISATDSDIADCFSALPVHAVTEDTPSEILRLIRRGDARGSFIDSHNGFMFVDGDGAQVSLQVALFRYTNRRPLLAIAWGNLGEPDYTHLSFFIEKDGRMVPADRSIFPVQDSSGLRFDLPRIGLTVLVQDSTGRVASKWTWNGARFIKTWSSPL